MKYIYIALLLLATPCFVHAEQVVLKDSSGRIVMSQSCEGECAAAVGAMEATRAGMGPGWAKAQIEVLRDSKYEQENREQEERVNAARGKLK